MLTPRETVKVAFLLMGAREGKTLAEIHELVKHALASKRAEWGLDLLTAGMKNIGGLARDVTGHAANKLIDISPYAAAGVLAGVPVLGGAAIGYTAGKLTGDDTDADELKDREIMEEYQMATDQAMSQRLLKQRQMGEGRPTRPLI